MNYAATADSSLRALVQRVRAGTMSAEQALAAALARADAYDAIQPQAWIARRPHAEVLARARTVDAALAAGAELPLAGAAFVVKDNIDVAGLATTAGCPDYAYLPTESAPVVARLEAAGAVVLGKTNLDQFATGLVGTRSPHGIPACVYNLDYISGGSSSGSAVLVAAGVAEFGLGTDTAGSGRVPAAFNGLVGYKPTRGRWSTRGVVPACRTLDCVTVFTRSVADAARVDAVCDAFDVEDPYARATPAAAPPAAGAFRFGVPAPAQLKFLGDGESARLYAEAVTRLTAAGGVQVVVDVAPLLAAAELLYSGPWVAERTAALESVLAARPASIHPVVRGILQGGARLSAVEAFRGFYELQRHARSAEQMFATIDVLLLPTTPTTYRIRELLAEPLALNGNLGLYTNFVNLLDLAALALPAGFRANGTGFGVSLIAPAWRDAKLFAWGERYAAAGADAPPPLAEAPRAEGVRLAVVGAHLAGMPLHWQLTSRAARLVATTRTAPVYRLYAMAHSTPPKPALIHTGPGDGAGAIEVEVYELDVAAFGSFVAEVPPPLAIGTVTLADGSTVKGFVAEPRAAIGAEDVTARGGWRAYLAARG